MSFTAYCKRTWARALLQGVHFSDSHRQLNVLYQVRDPWALDCDRERSRFEATNRIIRREFGQVGSLLEIGCGEGLQSVYLKQVCGRLSGVDVSPVAVARARARCPDADFFTADILRGAAVVPDRSDLVIACEVLYYVSQVGDFLDRMSALGKACLVTYHAPYRADLEPQLSRKFSVKTELIRADETEWVANWWTT